MPVRSFHTINGKIRGMTQNSASVPLRTTYFHDALGNVVATTNQYGVAKPAVRYSDWGAKVFDNGGWGALSFGWSGMWSYRALGSAHSDIYVRTNHYSSSEGRWTSRSVSYDGSATYAYRSANPVLARSVYVIKQSRQTSRTYRGPTQPISLDEAKRDCLSYSIPLPIGFTTVEVDVKLCWQVLDPCGCKPKSANWATVCWDADASAGIAFDLPGINDIEAAEKLFKDLENIKNLYNNIVNLMHGQPPGTVQHGCERKVLDYDIDACLTVCAAFAEGTLCLGYGNNGFVFKPPQYTVGLCGSPSGKISIKGEVRYCY